jgi:hypothetical protein
MPVSIEAGTAIPFGTPQVIGRYPPWGVRYDIHPDEDKFLFMRLPQMRIRESTEEAPPEIASKIITVTNWFEELKEKVPVL